GAAGHGDRERRGGRKRAACDPRSYRVREGSLVHGEPDRVALSAHVRERVHTRARGAFWEPRVRREFVEGLVELAAEDERIVLLTGDLGFAALEPFIERFPDRFFNAGVAEQNMVGMATGLAEAGFTPYVYSISTFASMRPYEFIRNGPVLHRLPVRIVGIGEGVDYGHNGVTHYALEDLALMRAQPGLAVITPADSRQIRPALHAVQELDGPAYIRLSKQSFAVPGLGDQFEIGRAHQLSEGDDAVVVAVGGMGTTAVDCAALLGESGISAGVVVVS